MPQILFKRRFFDAIRRGDKTTTLRRWKSCRLKAGARAQAPGIGWLNILACDQIDLKDLTAADARADGFASLEDLLETLAEIYPDQKSDGRAWFRIKFLPDKTAPMESSKESPRKRKPVRTLRKRLARQIRADLDKAVRQSGSLFLL